MYIQNCLKEFVVGESNTIPNIHFSNDELKIVLLNGEISVFL